MTVELRVVSGARSGVRERFAGPVVSVGRHPLSDLRFDAYGDIDVSARHAELRQVEGEWTILDQESTNGTFVNGERIDGRRGLRSGDTIAFGAHGPRVEVHLPDAPGVAGPRGRTTARVAAAVRAETRSLRRGLVVSGAAALALIGAGALWMQQRASARDLALRAAIARGDSASAELERMVTAMRRIHDRNDAAIAMIASDLDGTVVAGTAFGVTPEGLLVTNRHVVLARSGRPPRRLRVLYANTRDWLTARVVRMSDMDDLALLRIEAPGRYPVVGGVSRDGALARVGAPIATIGYPHAVEIPMEGTGVRVTARTTTSVGTVGKRLRDVLQIDSYAGKGSSGSPVFDSRGDVVGVVYGGAPESNGRIAYAVPSERLAAFIGPDAAAILR